MSNQRPAAIKEGDGISYVLLTYGDDGQLVGADTTPVSNDFVGTLDSAVQAASLSVLKRSSTTGIYDVFFSPGTGTFSGGDTFSIIEKVTIGGLDYYNSWSCVAVQEMRGTDNANTVAPDTAAIADIKDSTDKLETTVVQAGSVYQFTSNALENAPTGSGGGGGDATASNQTAHHDAVNTLD